MAILFAVVESCIINPTRATEFVKSLNPSEFEIFIKLLIILQNIALAYSPTIRGEFELRL